MNDVAVKLNSKIQRATRARRSASKGIRYNRWQGVLFTDPLPHANDTTAALAVNESTYKVYVNGGDRWYAIDRHEETIPAINGKHIIFVRRSIIFFSLFYYNENAEKIHITYLDDETPIFETEFTEDLVIEEFPGYNLYASYVEVME